MTGKGADIVCDASSIPIADGIYDVVICAEVLERVKSPEKVLSEISRVCAVGGHVYLTAPFLFPVHADPYDFRRFTAACWREMIRRCRAGGYQAHNRRAIYIQFWLICLECGCIGKSKPRFALWLICGLTPVY